MTIHAILSLNIGHDYHGNRYIHIFQDYGPDGIFYKLSLTCFNYKTKEYEYQVCPFQKITQDHFPGTAFSLGKVSTWSSRKNGRYLLRMEGGDTHLCPDGIGRISVVS